MAIEVSSSIVVDDDRSSYNFEMPVDFEGYIRVDEGQLWWHITAHSDTEGSVAYGYGTSIDDTKAMWDEILDSFANSTSDYIRGNSITRIREAGYRTLNQLRAKAERFFNN